MSERKVGGKKKSARNSEKNLGKNSEIKRSGQSASDKEYEDFLSKYSSELRMRRTANEPKKRTDKKYGTSGAYTSDITDNFSITGKTDESRCGEIDPHLLKNPMSEHQILTKRTGRILSDDTGFKAMSYNQRFELKAEMPEIPESNTETSYEDNSIPGQQTMAQIAASGIYESNLNAPVEERPDENNDIFKNIYKELRDSVPADMGKSEKLRAIARTAADDTSDNESGQLTFPAFEPFFDFNGDGKKDGKDKRRKVKKSSEKDRKQSKRSEKRSKRENNAADTPFDIDENQIVTHRSQSDENYREETPDTGKNKKTGRLFDFIKETGDELYEESPEFEINSKSEVKASLAKLKKLGAINLIKTGLLLIFGSILIIISFAFENTEEPKAFLSYCFLSAVFLLISGAVCVKELFEGVKNLKKLRFTQYTGTLIIFASALLQTFAAMISANASGENLKLAAPAAVISLTAVVIPKVILNRNSRLAVEMISGNKPVSIFKEASDGGIEYSLKERTVGKSGTVRYWSEAVFTTGLMKKLADAVPKPFASNAAYILLLTLSVVAAAGAGIIEKSVYTGISVFAFMVTVSLPTSYLMSASLMLLGTNKSLSEKRSSLLSCRCASELTKTNAVVLNACDIIEQEACSIHGIKTFGTIDPKKSTLYCASAVNGAKSPLAAIMKQVTDRSGEDVPEAKNINIESGGGISADTDGSKVLLGTRDFLEKNGVRIPDIDYGEKFITGDRKLLYLAVDGKFSILLIVSYRIKRSSQSFLRYLASKDIKVIIHSSDPNINAPFIAKKCKLNEYSLIDADSAEASYFTDMETKVQPALQAAPFSDGTFSSSVVLMRKAFGLSPAVEKLPFAIYILSLISAMLAAVPILLGNTAAVGSIYILIIKIICFAAGLIISHIASKRNKKAGK